MKMPQLFCASSFVMRNTTDKQSRIYYINIPVCVILLAVLQLSLHIRPRTERHSGLLKFDWAGILLVGGSVSTLLLGLLSGGVSHPWSSAAVIAPLVIGAAGFICLAIVEYFVPIPIFPRELIKCPTFNASCYIFFVGGYTVNSLAYFLIVYVGIPLFIPLIYLRTTETFW